MKNAKAIEVALPRLKQASQKMKSQVDRLGTLVVYISDSTTQGDAARRAAEKSRQSTPFEGTAISPETEIAAMVRHHFGPDSVIPSSVEDFPSALQEILSRHITNLKQKE